MTADEVKVQLAGELSYYLVNRATGRVKQIKSRRDTGRVFATDITASKRAPAIIKQAIENWKAAGAPT